MNVWIITINENGEGGWIDKIFTDEEKATQYYNENRKNYSGCMFMDIEEYETE